MDLVDGKGHVALGVLLLDGELLLIYLVLLDLEPDGVVCSLFEVLEGFKAI